MKDFRSILNEQINTYYNDKNGGSRHKSQSIVFTKILMNILEEQHLLDLDVDTQQEFTTDAYMKAVVFSLRQSSPDSFDRKSALDYLRDPNHWPEAMQKLVTDLKYQSLKNLISQTTKNLTTGEWKKLNNAEQTIEVGIGAATKKRSIATGSYSVSIDDTGRLSVFDKKTKTIVSDEHSQTVILKQMFDLIPKEYLRQLPSSSHSAYSSGSSFFPSSSSSSSSSSSTPPEPNQDLDEESLSIKPMY